MRESIQTTIVDVALAETSVEDEDLLEVLCAVHTDVTERVCQQHAGVESVVGNNLMDFEEYLGVGRAL